MGRIKTFLGVLLVSLCSTSIVAAETNTVSSTVVTDKAPPTASAPSVVVNNSDVCKSAFSAGVQTQVLGIASGVTITDENCERLKLSRSLFGMGMKVAAVAALCQDARIFDAMIMAGTPCPYKGKIGAEAQKGWEENPQDIPSGSLLMADLKKNKVTPEKTRTNHDYKTQDDPFPMDEND
tara:strand:+ start:1057 stop:1596 length:540 start_codon:yes stop_codon:yes gene_type:complete